MLCVNFVVVVVVFSFLVSFVIFVDILFFFIVFGFVVFVGIVL